MEAIRDHTGQLPTRRVDRVRHDRFARVQRQIKIDLELRLVDRHIDPPERMTSDETERVRNRVEHEFVVRQRGTATQIVATRARDSRKVQSFSVAGRDDDHTRTGHADQREFAAIVQNLTVLRVSEKLIEVGISLERGIVHSSREGPAGAAVNALARGSGRPAQLDIDADRTRGPTPWTRRSTFAESRVRLPDQQRGADR